MFTSRVRSSHVQSSDGVLTGERLRIFELRLLRYKVSTPIGSALHGSDTWFLLSSQSLKIEPNSILYALPVIGSWSIEILELVSVGMIGLLS